MEAVIRIEKLTKRYKETQAVKDLSLTVRKGEIYGFIGLNGSGKTTTLRMLLGMIKPTRGSCFLLEEKVKLSNYKLWEKVGYMVETPYAYPELTVKENLELIRKLRLIQDTRAVDHTISELQLTPYANRKAKHLSLGNAQRLGLAKALLHQPEILILDEPVNGLDPAGIVEVRELLRNLAKNKGVTIFLSSHLLSEVALIADKIGIIHHGRLIEEFEADRLESLIERKLLIGTRQNEAAAKALASQGIACRIGERGFLEISGKDMLEKPETVSGILVNNGFSLIHISVEEESLEAYFLRSIRKESGEP
ncbi:ABC transporter ATP-binding protein [Planococcus dechangensis]|uniref:ABC transporter ATP-binding protein n=1 Tax=Planococcus dechangensis TaxID=1176255 RepID=A0ABV9MI17_9BACL